MNTDLKQLYGQSDIVTNNINDYITNNINNMMFPISTDLSEILYRNLQNRFSRIVENIVDRELYPLVDNIKNKYCNTLNNQIKLILEIFIKESTNDPKNIKKYYDNMFVSIQNLKSKFYTNEFSREMPYITGKLKAALINSISGISSLDTSTENFVSYDLCNRINKYLIANFKALEDNISYTLNSEMSRIMFRAMELLEEFEKEYQDKYAEEISADEFLELQRLASLIDSEIVVDNGKLYLKDRDYIRPIEIMDNGFITTDLQGIGIYKDSEDTYMVTKGHKNERLLFEKDRMMCMNEKTGRAKYAIILSDNELKFFYGNTQIFDDAQKVIVIDYLSRNKAFFSKYYETPEFGDEFYKIIENNRKNFIYSKTHINPEKKEELDGKLALVGYRLDEVDNKLVATNLDLNTQYKASPSDHGTIYIMSNPVLEVSPQMTVLTDDTIETGYLDVRDETNGIRLTVNKEKTYFEVQDNNNKYTVNVSPNNNVVYKSNITDDQNEIKNKISTLLPHVVEYLDSLRAKQNVVDNENNQGINNLVEELQKEKQEIINRYKELQYRIDKMKNDPLIINYLDENQKENEEKFNSKIF